MQDQVTSRLVKKALIRDPRAKPGKPADMFIECCGNMIHQAIPPVIAATVCPTCGTAYDVNGYIVDTQ